MEIEQLLYTAIQAKDKYLQQNPDRKLVLKDRNLLLSAYQVIRDLRQKLNYQSLERRNLTEQIRELKLELQTEEKIAEHYRRKFEKAEHGTATK